MNRSVSSVGVNAASEMQTLVQAASLAPFSHNTQPWLFRLNGSVVDVLADRTRAASQRPG